MVFFFRRLGQAVHSTVRPALSTIVFLLYIMIPVSLVMLVLENSGLLYYAARFLDPFMHFLGLPGAAALAFLSAVFLNIYSAIAVMQTLYLSGREAAILSVMCLIAHNFFVECAVMKKTGSSLFKMVLLRLFFAFLTARILHFIMPPLVGTGIAGAGPLSPPPLGLNLETLPGILKSRMQDSGLLIIRIALIVFILMFIQKVMNEFGVMRLLAKIFTPLMRIFGLSANMAYSWIIAYVVGIVYGSAVLIEQVRSGAVSRLEADLFNHHTGISHSHVEDTLLFVTTLGVPLAWAALPRLAAALMAVWLERARRAWVRRSFRVKVMP
ncbi:MAG: transporter [Treponema sp.]|jgi:spore maturation protein SpmB|nr:transporter [Treponema sp.]